MALNLTLHVEKELAALQRLGTKDLQARYAEVYGEPTRSHHKQWLVKRIIWRMQANAEGDLSERARRRAMELAQGADVRTTIPKPPKSIATAPTHTVTAKLPQSQDARLPVPGTLITRDYKGESLRVTVLPDCFEYQGEVYKSLSAVAKAITGSHCNGYHFFRLNGGTP